MRSPKLALYVAAFACSLLLLPISPVAADYRGEHVCRFCTQARLADVKPQSNGRQYAPDRLVDVENVRIDVTPDFDKRTVSGRTTITFTPIARPLPALHLHAHQLHITEVTGSADVADRHTDGDDLIITFTKPLPAGKQASVTIAHAAEPKKGLYFRTPAQAYKPGDIHLWTQGETHESRHWYPSFDYPNERFTSEVICRVPPDMTVLSNGRLVSERVDKQTGLKVVHWHQDKPHVNYLIALAAGKFAKIEGKYRDLSLRFFTPPSQAAHAHESFKDTADMMGWFERELAVPYPWARYDQVVVDDFNWGGMENTTLTILNDYTLHPAETEPIRSSQNLVAHEIAHQWFGNLLTCQDWSQIWLNEGFATYYAHLYDAHKNGRESMLYGLYRDAGRIFQQKDERRPIVFRNYKHTWEQFDPRAYQKGSWVLHMLRTQLGEDLFRRCVTEYLKRNTYRSVVTQDLHDVFAELSGLSLQQFFDQWVYHARHPELTVTQSWDPKTKLAKVSVKQTQKTDGDVLLFRFPVKLRFRTPKGVVERPIEVTQQEQDFYVPLPDKPTAVRFDADFGLLAEIKFDKPKDMLYAQLADKDDMMGRVLAAAALGKHDDARTVEALEKALNHDAFWGVRVEAAKALGEIKTDAARQALAGGLHQEDARATKQVVTELGERFHPEARAALMKVVRSKAPLDVRAEAVRGLGRYQDPAVAKVLGEALKSDSYRQTLALAAVQAVRRLDDPALAPLVLDTLRQREGELRSWDIGKALDSLAYVARNQDNRDDVRQFLVGYVTHPRRPVRVSALKALGVLGDPKAITVVESFVTGNDQDRVSQAAEQALKNLNDVKTVPVELKDLRGEVTDLKKENESLRKDVDALKKQLEALNGK